MNRIFCVLLCLILTVGWGFEKKIPPDKKAVSVEYAKKGYEAELPDIYGYFDYKRNDPSFYKGIKTAPFNGKQALIPAPFDNKTYIDVILKRDKTSPYLNDVLQILPFVENLKSSLVKEENLQKFNSRVGTLSFYVRALEKKYSSKSESKKPAYKQIMYLTYKAKALSNLKYEAQTYSRFLLYEKEGIAYSPANIKKSERELLGIVNTTISVIKAER